MEGCFFFQWKALHRVTGRRRCSRRSPSPRRSRATKITASFPTPPSWKSTARPIRRSTSRTSTGRGSSWPSGSRGTRPTTFPAPSSRVWCRRGRPRPISHTWPARTRTRVMPQSTGPVLRQWSSRDGRADWRASTAQWAPARCFNSRVVTRVWRGIILNVPWIFAHFCFSHHTTGLKKMEQ